MGFKRIDLEQSVNVADLTHKPYIERYIDTMVSHDDETTNTLTRIDLSDVGYRSLFRIGGRPAVRYALDPTTGQMATYSTKAACKSAIAVLLSSAANPDRTIRTAVCRSKQLADALRKPK